MMDPLGAPQATRAWATACVTKKEPCNKPKGEAKTNTIDNNREPENQKLLALNWQCLKPPPHQGKCILLKLVDYSYSLETKDQFI